ncbi:DUF427 domain-containing protein [Kribbella sp. ALI-6-A]|uniref:DUF427 domain-containing protein n=1 Tax=Kribbella sp. ALI-6-A TaxID=1933817 RepID=UPI001EDB3E92|nr:DUF427 domain-containing protein [Kribbella sp. ALI-6-A]
MPVARRIRALHDGKVVLDTQDAVYVWEFPPYPQYYVPAGDVAAGVLADTGETRTFPHGEARVLTAGSGTAWQYDEGLLAGLVRFEWEAVDSWFEEDEEVFVHPRNPYARVDAIKSSRHVQVSLDGISLADSTSTVIVYETGLPPRYYFPRTTVAFEHLEPSQTRTACPYKGRTTGYWSVRTDSLHPDLAWCYDFPTAPLLPVAGHVAFFNEKVDLTVDGVTVDRPVTPFS